MQRLPDPENSLNLATVRIDDPTGALAAEHHRTVELIAAYERLRARDPARVEVVAGQAREYARTLRHLGVRNPWGLEVELIEPARLVAATPIAPSRVISAAKTIRPTIPTSATTAK